jgi:hypothetical protein
MPVDKDGILASGCDGHADPEEENNKASAAHTENYNENYAAANDLPRFFLQLSSPWNRFTAILRSA